MKEEYVQIPVVLVQNIAKLTFRRQLNRNWLVERQKWKENLPLTYIYIFFFVFGSFTLRYQKTFSYVSISVSLWNFILWESTNLINLTHLFSLLFEKKPGHTSYCQHESSLLDHKLTAVYLISHGSTILPSVITVYLLYEMSRPIFILWSTGLSTLKNQLKSHSSESVSLLKIINLPLRSVEYMDIIIWRKKFVSKSK